MSLGPGEKYNIAEVRAHQFVETWCSRKAQSIHVRAHVANQRGGMGSGGAFTPIVTLSFQDKTGKQLAHAELRYFCQRKEEWVNSDLPLTVDADVWLMSDKIVASAAEGHHRVSPPPTFTIFRENFP